MYFPVNEYCTHCCKMKWTWNVEKFDHDGWALMCGTLHASAPTFLKSTDRFFWSMGPASLLTYDPNSCAQQSNNQNADSNGGACKYFNIWAELVKFQWDNYRCNWQHGTLTSIMRVDSLISFSRNNLVIDEGFEGFNACTNFLPCYLR
jgi:hypothetical protein